MFNFCILIKDDSYDQYFCSSFLEVETRDIYLSYTKKKILCDQVQSTVKLYEKTVGSLFLENLVLLMYHMLISKS
jgi:hypothetical protein